MYVRQLNAIDCSATPRRLPLLEAVPRRQGRQAVLAWDEGARLAFRVDATSAPAFRAWVEDYHFDSDGRGGTVLRVAIGGKGRLAFKLAAPIMPRAFTFLMTRAGHKLERGRWFSTPKI
jgi:hypothetical protein